MTRSPNSCVFNFIENLVLQYKKRSDRYIKRIKDRFLSVSEWMNDEYIEG